MLKRAVKSECNDFRPNQFYFFIRFPLLLKRYYYFLIYKVQWASFTSVTLFIVQYTVFKMAGDPSYVSVYLRRNHTLLFWSFLSLIQFRTRVVDRILNLWSFIFIHILSLNKIENNLILFNFCGYIFPISSNRKYFKRIYVISLGARKIIYLNL